MSGRRDDNRPYAEMYLGGMTCAQIATEAGITEGVVRKWLKRRGVKMRSSAHGMGGNKRYCSLAAKLEAAVTAGRGVYLSPAEIGEILKR